MKIDCNCELQRMSQKQLNNIMSVNYTIDTSTKDSFVQHECSAFKNLRDSPPLRTNNPSGGPTVDPNIESLNSVVTRRGVMSFLKRLYSSPNHTPTASTARGKICAIN